jgi:hypothetical protein
MDKFFLDSVLDIENKDHDITIKVCRLSKNVICINPIPIYIKEHINCFNLINTKLKDFISENYDKNFIKIESALVSESRKNKIPQFIFKNTASAAFITNIMGNTNNKYIKLIRHEIKNGIIDILKNVYNYNNDFIFDITKSTILTYEDFTFLNTHRHFDLHYEKCEKRRFLYLVGVYYVDDGDPIIENKYCGCVTFLTNNKTIHIRPYSGTILLWEGDLQHLVNPFISKTKKNRMLITMNITVIF